MRGALATAFLFGLVLAPTTTRADDAVNWYAALDADNPSYLEVDLDLSGLETNALASATFTVRYYDEHSRVLGIQQFSSFSDGPLTGGRVYRRYFPVPYPSAGRAVGLSMTPTVQTEGGGFLKKPMDGMAASAAIPKGFPRKGAPIAAASAAPASAQVLGGGPPRLLRLRLPQDGAPNHNAAIGPFCCTGSTAQVRDSRGATVGYVYAFGFQNEVDAPNGGATTISVLVSAEGAADPSGKSGRAQGQADFDAATWRPDTVRTVRVGPLTYQVTLTSTLHVLGGVKRLDLQTAQADVRVNGVQ